MIMWLKQWILTWATWIRFQQLPEMSYCYCYHQKRHPVKLLVLPTKLHHTAEHDWNTNGHVHSVNWHHVPFYSVMLLHSAIYAMIILFVGLPRSFQNMLSDFARQSCPTVLDFWRDLRQLQCHVQVGLKS